MAPPGGGAAGDQRSELWFFYHLGRRMKEKLAGSADERDRPLLDLAWDYRTRAATSRPARDVLRHDQRDRPAHRAGRSSRTLDLRADGVTALRLLDLQRGVRRRGQPGRAPQAAAGAGTGPAPEWGWAWPPNRRILYNRASADPEGRPWSERKA